MVKQQLLCVCCIAGVRVLVTNERAPTGLLAKIAGVFVAGAFMCELRVKNLVAVVILVGLFLGTIANGGAADCSSGNPAHKVVEYTNPVCKEYFADPAVLKDGDFYYAFGTGDTKDGKRFPVQKSRDLVHWEPLGGALIALDDASKTDYWAPEPARNGDKYYLYYSAGNSTGLDHQLRVAVAARPEGPYKDSGKLLIPSEPFSIDSHPFRDDDGRWYLYFVKDELEGDRPGTAIAVVRLNDDMVSVAEKPRTILRPSAKWQIFGTDREWYGRKWKEWYCIEGPYIIKKDGKYFCIYSGGCWETPRYGLAYGVSDSPLGPFDDKGTTGGACLLSGNDEFIGPGHNSLATGPDGKTYVVYHAWDKAHTARRMCIDPLVWNGDVPKCDGPKHCGTITLR